MILVVLVILKNTGEEGKATVRNEFNIQMSLRKQSGSSGPGGIWAEQGAVHCSEPPSSSWASAVSSHISLNVLKV